MKKLLNKLNSSKNLITFFKKKLTKSKNKFTKDLVAISLSQGCAIAFITINTKNEIILKSYAFSEASELSQQEIFLNDFIKDNDLQEKPCSLVLSGNQYKLALIDLPDFPENSVKQEVIKKNIADFIDYPAAEAMIDLFQLSLKRASDNKDVAYVVMAHKNEVLATIEMINGLNLELNYIDIPEFALRNFINKNSNINKGVLIVNLTRTGANFLISRKNEIFVSRKLDIDLTPILYNKDVPVQPSEVLDSPLMEDLILSLQRSLDYCRSLFRQLPAQTVLLLPSEIDLEVIKVCLEKGIDLKVEILDLEFLNIKDPQLLGQHIGLQHAIGGAMRNCVQEE